LAILILIALIACLILGNYEKFIYVYYLFISEFKLNCSLKNFKVNTRKIKNKSTKVNKMSKKKLFINIFKMNSYIKIFIVSIIFIIIFLNIFNTKPVRFILVELLITITTIVIIQMLKNTDGLFKILFGQIVLTFIFAIIAIGFFQLDLEYNEFKIPIFLIAITLLISPLFISLNMYYSASNSIYKVIHFILCLINIIAIFFLMLTYIGYGFMFYKLQDLHVNVNDGRVNVYNQITLRNGFFVLVTYGLDRLSNIHIQVGGKSVKESIGFGTLLFSLISRTIVSTYVALVFAFITNALVNRSGKDKN
jgi:hypothetical protein